MKLISARIENFGKLKGVDVNFSERITQIFEANGSGKTTLASFIKAMFYGLPPIRANSKDFNDRKHFYPFDGGKFGGSLNFEWKGEKFRIERFFDRKSDTEDSLTVYKNGMPFSGFGANIGMAVFGLDITSFERTVFINSESIDICATSGIGAKLNNFFDSDDNTNTYENAITNLENAKRRLKAVRGNNDLISLQTGKISSLKFEIANLENCEKALGDYYTALNKLKAEILAGEEREKAQNKRKVLAEKWNVYNTYMARVCEYRSAEKNFLAKYPKGLPNAEEVKKIKADGERALSIQSQNLGSEFSPRKEEQLKDLSQKFSQGTPSKTELEDMKGDIEKLSIAENKAKNYTENIGENEKIVLQKFAQNPPSQRDIMGATEKVERYKLLDEQLKQRACTLPENKGSVKNSGGKSLIFAIIFALVAVFGVALIFVNLIAGIAVTLLGVFGFVISTLIMLKRGGNANTPADGSALRAELVGCEDKIHEFLVPFGYYSASGVVYDFAKFCDDYKLYCTLLDREKAKRDERAKVNSQIEGMHARLDIFFSRFGLSEGSFQDRYISLCADIERFVSLRAEKDSHTSEGELRNRELNNLLLHIQEILKKYNISLRQDFKSQIEELLIDCSNFTRLEESISREVREAENYKKINSLGDMPELTGVDDGLSEKLNRARHDLAVIEGQIADTESMVERLDEKRSQLETEEGILSEYRERYKILNGAIEGLKRAEQNLQDRYIAPIRDRFLKYSSALESALGEKIIMGRDYGISFERGGELRSDRHLSSGQRSLCALCFRLALIDNIFAGQKPFVIMDDPFVNLDAEHLKRTSALLSKLSQDTQIVYLTCHNSRTVK
jgi:energy-coupling factor transporter ATP-binding protein EcfA2